MSFVPLISEDDDMNLCNIWKNVEENKDLVLILVQNFVKHKVEEAIQVSNSLNIEKIKELEAELLIGREINLERARYFALTNDITGLMNELNNEMGTFSDFQGLNVIQQQALAESLGMNVGQLSEMLLKQEYLNEQGEIIKDTTDEDLRTRLESLSTQTKFNLAIEKMQGLIGDLVQGPLGTFMDIMGAILENSIALGAVLGVIATVQIVKMDKEFLRSFDEAIVTFKFIYRPEYLETGNIFIMREGNLKALGKVINIDKGALIANE